MIKKRRKTVDTASKPMSLLQLREKEKRAIAAMIKKHRAELPQFKDIMKTVLDKAKASTFKRLRGNRDFCDGFLLHGGNLSGGW